MSKKSLRVTMARRSWLVGIAIVGTLILVAGVALVLKGGEKTPLSVSIGELGTNPQEFVGKVVQIRGTITHMVKGTGLREVTNTIYTIDDGTGYINAVFRGDLPYSEQQEVTIKGTFKHEMPYWGPHAHPVQFIDIQEIREAT